MTYLKQSILCLVLVLAATSLANAQSVDVFGYSQSIFQQEYYESIDGANKESKNSFYQQQTNLFLSKRFDSSFSTFINMQIENNFDSHAGFGSISLDEAWARYRYNKAFSIKVGKLIPEYGSFNTIRNRTPLLDFATRPIIFEKLFREIFSDSPDFYPEYAFLQVNGSVALNDKFSLRYAAFTGNGDQQLMTSSQGERSSVLHVTGADTTTTVMVGGRVGIDYFDFDLGMISFGVSSSWDESYVDDITEDDLYPVAQALLGYSAPERSSEKAPRVRLGFDVNVELNRLNLRAEYHQVYNKFSDSQLAVFDDYDKTLQQALGFSSYTAKTDEIAWFVLGSYKLNHNWFVSASMQTTQTQFKRVTDKPVYSYTGGLGYRKGPIVLKAEYRYTSLDNDKYQPSTIDNILTMKQLYLSAGFTF